MIQSLDSVLSLQGTRFDHWSGNEDLTCHVPQLKKKKNKEYIHFEKNIFTLTTRPKKLFKEDFLNLGLL